MPPAVELCPYDPSHRYERAVRLEDRFLGSGGETDCVERCRRIEDGTFVAVKKIDKVAEDQDYFDEFTCLSLAHHHDVPNVVHLVELLEGDKTNSYLVLELISGFTFDEACCLMARRDLAGREDGVVIFAAELLLTLHVLHDKAELAHLDLTSNNIMFSSATGRLKVSDLRVIDFGFAQDSSDFHRKDVIPEGATIQFASPEQLQSLQLQSTLEDGFEPALINGQAADIWAVGVLCYVMMTGEHPFQPQGTVSKAPGHLPTAVREQWEEYASMASAHREWEKAVNLAAATSTPVCHSIIDKIRAATISPDLAVDFFLTLLAPDPSNRVAAVTALQHDYIRFCGFLSREAYYKAQVEKNTARLAHAQALVALEEEKERLQQGGPMQPNSQPQSSIQHESSSAGDAMSVAAPDGDATQQPVLVKPVSLLPAVAVKGARAVNGDQAVQHEQSPRIAVGICSPAICKDLAETGKKASDSTESHGNSCASTASSIQGHTAEHTDQAESLSSPASPTTTAPRTSSGVSKIQGDAAALSGISSASAAAVHEADSPNSLDPSADDASEAKPNYASDSSARAKKSGMTGWWKKSKGAMKKVLHGVAHKASKLACCSRPAVTD